MIESSLNWKECDNHFKNDQKMNGLFKLSTADYTYFLIENV